MKTATLTLSDFAVDSEIENLRAQGMCQSDEQIVVRAVVIGQGSVEIVLASGDRVTLADDDQEPLLEMFGEWREDL